MKKTPTPKQIATAIKQNMTARKTLKALYRAQLPGKLSLAELKGLQQSIAIQIENCKNLEVQQHLIALEDLGYTLTKPIEE